MFRARFSSSIGALGAAALLLVALPVTTASAATGCDQSAIVGLAQATGCFSSQDNTISTESTVVIGGFALTPEPGSSLVLDTKGGKIVRGAAQTTVTWGGAAVSTDPQALDFSVKSQKAAIPDVSSIFAADDFFRELAPAAPRDWTITLDSDGAGSTALGRADLQYFAQRAGSSGAAIGNLSDATGLRPDTGVSLMLASRNDTAGKGQPDPTQFALEFSSTNITFTGPVFGVDPSSAVLGILPVSKASLHRVDDPISGNHWQFDGSFNPELIKNQDPAASDSLLSYGKTVGEWKFSLIWGKTWRDGPKGFNAEIYKSSVLSGLTGSLAGLVGASVGVPLPFSVETIGAGARIDPLGARGELGVVLGPQTPFGVLGISPSAEVGLGAMVNPQCGAVTPLSASLGGDVFFKIPTPLVPTQFVVSGILCGTAQSATIGPIAVLNQPGSISDPTVKVLGKSVLRVFGIKLNQADVTGVIRGGKATLDAVSQTAVLGTDLGKATAHLSSEGLSTVCFTPQSPLGNLPGRGWAAEKGGLPYRISC
ncbi:MAG: hypothetical protein L0G87_15365 [Renibacterium salmoninarum]|nr:hypothetical protein [Renibacterium salmoninarum]